MEQDGGAIVTYYQFQQMNYMNPLFQIHVAPKVWEQSTPSLLPFVQYHKVGTKFLGDIPKEIPRIMKKNKIKLLALWHIPWEYFPIIDEVHKMGGYVLNWQTIHWKNDVLFMSDKLQDFDHWVPATNYAEQVFSEVGQIPKEKMTTIPHGVETDLFFPHPPTLDFGKPLKTILFVGRCQFTKGIVPFMLAARSLVNNFNCRVIFKAGVHDGIYKAKEIAHMLTMMSRWDKRIVFLPQWTPPSYMEELQNQCDILVCPSGHEGSSLPPLEAMACKKVVAITDIPVHRELLGGRNGECGMLMPATDPTEYVNDTQIVKVPSRDIIYGTLKFLLENPDEAAVMAEKGFERAKANYNMKLVCQKWFDLLEKFK